MSKLIKLYPVSVGVDTTVAQKKFDEEQDIYIMKKSRHETLANTKEKE